MAATREPRVNLTTTVIDRPAPPEGPKGQVVGAVIVSDRGPTSPNRITSYQQFLRTYTSGSFSRSSHISQIALAKLALTNELVVARSSNSNLLSGVTNTGLPVYKLRGGNNIFDHSTLHTTPSTTDLSTTGASILIGGIEYFSGRAGSTSDSVNIQGDSTSAIPGYNSTRFINDLVDYFRNNVGNSALIRSADIGDNLAIRLFSTGVSTVSATSATNGILITSVQNVPNGVQTNVIDTDTSTANFAIFALEPMATNSYTFTLAETNAGTDDGLYELTVNYPTSQTRTLPIAVSDADNDNSNFQDGFGRIIYLTYINEFDDLPVEVQVINDGVDVDVVSDPTSFGNSFYDATMSADTTFLTTALTSLFANDNQIGILSDSAITNANHQSSLISLASANNALAVVNAPTTFTSRSEIIAHKDNIGNTSQYSIFFGNSAFDRSVTPFETLIPAGIYYIEAVATQASANSEFAPIFGIENGRVPVSRLNVNFNLNDRDLLVADQINVIFNDEVSNIVYFNFNRTGITVDGLRAEEQNMRTINRLAREIPRIVRRFIGQTDTADTAASARADIETYIETRIQSQRFGLGNYQVQADAENNEFGNGILNINVFSNLNRAISQINIFHQVMPLQSS